MDPTAITKRFAAIVESEVARVAYRLAYTTLERDDLRSRGLEELIRAFARFDPTRGPLEPWLRRCVRSRLATALRDPVVRRNESHIEDIETVVNGANPEDLVMALERRDSVQIIFTNLPPRQYAVVSAAITGATVRETAVSLGVSPALVHKERKRAFALLARRWARHRED